MNEEEQTVSERLLGAESAKRLLSDPFLQGFLQRFAASATETAIIHLDAEQREAHRQVVLAIRAILAALEHAAAFPDLQKEEEARERVFE